MEPIELNDVIERCWGHVATREATLQAADAAAVLADPGRLQQLFENLFRNAVTHAGPDVTVTVGTLAVGFYVEDDGPGIPPDDRARVFESGYTTDDDGTGFGLRIVRTIAHSHGWAVRVSEGEAGGARFEVTGVRFD